MPICLVSLGANLGDRTDSIDAAIERLAAEPGVRRLAESGRLESDAVGGPAGQPAFINSVARLETDLAPRRLLATLQSIEDRRGRKRAGRWASRTLDLDLLAYGDLVVREERLRIPHPRMTFRRFVLDPAAEIAPDWRHPELGETLVRLRQVLHRGADAVRIIGEAGGSPCSGASVAQLLRADLSGAVRVATGGFIAAPKLTIDARREAPASTTPAGPTLALRDCVAEYWRDEALAALRCVWPAAVLDST